MFDSDFIKSSSIPEPPFLNTAGYLLSAFQSGEGYFWGKRTARRISQNDIHDYFLRIRSAYISFYQDVDKCESIDSDTKLTIFEATKSVPESGTYQRISDATPPLSSAILAVIRLAGQKLPQENLIGDGDKQSIRDSLEKLKRVIEQDDLPASVKEALHRTVRLTQEALDEYHLKGARGFRDTFRRMLGDLMELYAKEKPGKEDPAPWFEALYRHVVLVDGITSRALTYTPLLEVATASFLQYFK